MTFEETLRQSLLINQVGVCPIQLVQYDSATLHLSAQDFSARRFLKNQKRIYQELKPQKREILQDQHAVLTSSKLITFDRHRRQTNSIDLLSKNCQVTCYDLVSSYTEPSFFKYALVFSKRIKMTMSSKRSSNSHIASSHLTTSHFHQAVKSLPHRVPWLKHPASNIESIVILFNQKRQRKVWKQYTKKLFGLKVLNLNKAIYKNSVEKHYQESPCQDQYEQKKQKHDQSYEHDAKLLGIAHTPTTISPSMSYSSSLRYPPSLSASPTSYNSSPIHSPKAALSLSPRSSLKHSKLKFKQPPKPLSSSKPSLKFANDDMVENDPFNQELFQLTTKFNSQNNIIDDFNDLLMTCPVDYSKTFNLNYNNFIPPPNNPPKFKLPKSPE